MRRACGGPGRSDALRKTWSRPFSVRLRADLCFVCSRAARTRQFRESTLARLIQLLDRDVPELNEGGGAPPLPILPLVAVVLEADGAALGEAGDPESQARGARGGTWYQQEIVPIPAHCASRYPLNPDEPNDATGFRCVREVEAPESDEAAPR